MKLGCIFSFFALLLINFQVSDSVKCFGQAQNCTSCVYYRCPKFGAAQTGCPEDFFTDCSEQVEGVNFVKSKKYNDLEYESKETQVAYLSGCGNEEEDGTEFINKKLNVIKSKGIGKDDGYCYEAGIPCNNSSTQNSALKLIGILTIGWMISAALIY